MTKMSIKRVVKRRKLKALARACSDPGTADALDRAISRGAVSSGAMKRVAASCCDYTRTDALDALVY